MDKIAELANRLFETEAALQELRVQLNITSDQLFGQIVAENRFDLLLLNRRRLQAYRMESQEPVGVKVRKVPFNKF